MAQKVVFEKYHGARHRGQRGQGMHVLRYNRGTHTESGGPVLKYTRSIALVVIVLLALPALAAGKGKKVTLKGTLVDISCANERANDLDSLRVKHTRKCLQMPDCDKSGFALLTDDNKVLKFDDDGNASARKLIAGTDREKDWTITVQGRLEGDTLSVKKLTLAP